MNKNTKKKKRNSKNSDEADYDTTYTSDSSSLDIENVIAVPVQERQQISETGGIVVIMNKANSSKDKQRPNKIDPNENSSSMLMKEEKKDVVETKKKRVKSTVLYVGRFVSL